MAGSLKIKGVESLLKKIDKFGAGFSNEAKAAIEDIADRIENSAQTNAPDKRANREVSLAQNIGKFPSRDNWSWRVEVNSQALPFGAYIEFGTGQHAAAYVPTLPPDWQEVARLFYVNGKGTLRHTPFLYPAFFKHSPELIKELKLIIKRAKL